MTEPSVGASALDAWLRSVLADLLAPIATEQQAQRALLERLLPAQTIPVESSPEPAVPVETAPPVTQDPSPQPSPPIVVTPTLGANLVEITGTNGWVWTLDLAVVPAVGPWPGPYGDQWRTTAEVPADYAGCTSLRVVVDWGKASSGVPWADVWLRNDIAMRDGGGPASYSVRVVLDGQEGRRQDVAKHHQYRGWGRLLSTGPLPELPWPDAATLRAAGVANYAGSVDADVLARYVAAMSEPSWGSDPFSPRGLTYYMPGVGGRGDIGPATAPLAAALISRDPRMRAYVIGQAEAAGTIPWHHWDAEHGCWLRITDHPRLWTDPRGAGQAGGTLLQPVPSPDEVGWELDTAHQPDSSFIAYLLTGRRAFLDNLQAQAAWNIVAQWADLRGASDTLVVQHNQVRGAAWGLRQIDEAAWASPEGSAERAYFSQASEANWSWIVEQLPAWTEMQGEVHGWLPGEYGTNGALPPWQQDYFASTAIASARRGNPHARTFLEWARNFLVGRFEKLGHDAVAYLIAINDPDTGRDFTTWAEVKAKTQEWEWSNGDGWGHTEGDYAQWGRWTLAGYAELFNDAEARRWFDALPQQGAPFTQPGDYTRDPFLSIAPAA
jgi:hypothetical protein